MARASSSRVGQAAAAEGDGDGVGRPRRPGPRTAVGRRAARGGPGPAAAFSRSSRASRARFSSAERPAARSGCLAHRAAPLLRISPEGGDQRVELVVGQPVEVGPGRPGRPDQSSRRAALARSSVSIGRSASRRSGSSAIPSSRVAGDARAAGRRPRRRTVGRRSRPRAGRRSPGIDRQGQRVAGLLVDPRAPRPRAGRPGRRGRRRPGVLDDHDALEQRTCPGGRRSTRWTWTSGVSSYRRSSTSRAWKAPQPGDERGLLVDGDPERQRVDEQADHRLDALRSAGRPETVDAEDHVGPAAVARQQQGPGPLDDRAQGQPGATGPTAARRGGGRLGERPLALGEGGPRARPAVGLARSSPSGVGRAEPGQLRPPVGLGPARGPGRRARRCSRGTAGPAAGRARRPARSRPRRWRAPRRGGSAGTSRRGPGGGSSRPARGRRRPSRIRASRISGASDGTNPARRSSRRKSSSRPSCSAGASAAPVVPLERRGRPRGRRPGPAGRSRPSGSPSAGPGGGRPAAARPLEGRRVEVAAEQAGELLDVGPASGSAGEWKSIPSCTGESG